MPIACLLIPAFGIVCERAKLPALEGQPLALIGSDGLLKVISEEALPFGVRPGQRASGAQSLCPRLITRLYDEEAYRAAAHSVWDLLAIESSVVEPVSPELSFLEISGPDAACRLHALAREAARQANTPIKAGLASSRLTAHQAALRAEPSFCAEPFVVAAGREADFLAPLTLASLPELDSALLKRLSRLGVRTLGDVLQIKSHELHRLCRQYGFLLRRLATGQDGGRVRAAWPPRSLEETLRLEAEICDETEICEALRLCAERLARRLIAGRDYCRAVGLAILLEDGTETGIEETLKEPIRSARGLHRSSVRLLRRLRLRQAALGVRVTTGGLGVGSATQLVLLDEFGNGFLRERRERLDAALQMLRKRYGEQAISPASTLRPLQRIDLWTSSLTRTVSEPVEVTLNAQGAPQHFLRGGRRYDIESVQDRWKEADWLGARLQEKTAYRVTTRSGLYELQHVNTEWRIIGIAD